MQTSARSILVGHELALGVLMDMQKVWDVQTAVEADEDIPIESLSDILCSDVGCTLYRGESIAMKYKLFVQNIEKHLKHLQFHDYDATEMASFRNLMKIEGTKAIGDSPSFAARDGEVPFLTSMITVDVVTVNDEWMCRLHAQIRSHAVSQCEVPRMSWEELLFGDEEPLPGHPTETNWPQDVLRAATNSRSSALKLLAPFEHALTFADYRKIVGGQRGYLVGLDRMWSLEHDYLMCVAEPLGEQMIRDSAMQALPHGAEAGTFLLKDSLTKLQELRASSLVAACDKKVGQDLTTLTTMLEHLQAGQSVTPQRYACQGEWFRSALGRCELFATPDGLVDTSTSGPGCLRGRKAVDDMWLTFSKVQEKARTLTCVKHLRQFLCMLDQAQADLVQSVVSIGIRQHQRNALVPAVADKPLHEIGDKDDDSVVVVGTAAAGACASDTKEEGKLAKAFVQQASLRGSGKASSSSGPADSIAEAKQLLLASFMK